MSAVRSSSRAMPLPIPITPIRSSEIVRRRPNMRSNENPGHAAARGTTRIASGITSTSHDHHGSRHSDQPCCTLTIVIATWIAITSRIVGAASQRDSTSASCSVLVDTSPSGLDIRMMTEKTCGITEDAFPDPVTYGRSLPMFCANLLVRDVARSVPFYRDCLGATVRYLDEEFAALVLGGTPLMLHRDSTYATHPWSSDLATGALRGLGA